MASQLQYLLPRAFDWRAWQEPEDNVDFQNAAISSVRLHAPISAEMLTNYWTAIKELEGAVASKELKHDEVTNATTPFLESNKSYVIKNKSIDAMLYFGERGWPDDFILALGYASIGGCGSGTEYDYKFGFYAWPRKLFTLVAVIEPRYKDLQIEHIVYEVDSKPYLRPLQEGEELQDSPPGVITIQKGEMAVIPLRIELRYDLDKFLPVSPMGVAQKVYARLGGVKLPTLKLTGRESYDESDGLSSRPLRTVFSKSVSSFRSPEMPKITETYVSGPAFGLKTLRITGTDVAVRTSSRRSRLFGQSRSRLLSIRFRF